MQGSFENGSAFINEVIVLDENKKLIDENRSDSQVTMDVIQGIANSVNPMIKLTVETPCNFPDGQLPVLDVKVNINLKENYRIELDFWFEDKEPSCHFG